MTHVIYGIDLDGTAYDNGHREHMIPQDRNDTAAWVAFNSACVGDTPRWPVIDLVRGLIAAGKDVRFLTGRGQSAHTPTLTVLARDFNMSRTLIPLTMRPMTDYRKAAEFKADVVRQWQASTPGCHVLMIDDDPLIIEALRVMPGVTVLQIDTLCSAVRTEAGQK